MNKLNLWLIRHGESTANVGIWHDNPSKILLTAKGEEQAKLAAENIIQQPDLLIISPLLRAKKSALPILMRWPKTPVETLPIQEIVYLSPSQHAKQSVEARQIAKKNYWDVCDPFYCDGNDAESFASFVTRVNTFKDQVKRQQGFVVVVGHGQFFKAFLLSLDLDFIPTAYCMRKFHTIETRQPINNGEIIRLNF